MRDLLFSSTNMAAMTSRKNLLRAIVSNDQTTGRVLRVAIQLVYSDIALFSGNVQTLRTLNLDAQKFLNECEYS